MKMNIISSWSGGKDSCFACYKAMESGHRVKYLLNFVSKEHRRCCFHGIKADLLSLQTRTIGIPLYQKGVSDNMKEYEAEFKEAVTQLKSAGISGMAFGDIYLDEHREWVARVCRELEIVPVEPLWDISPEKIALDFVSAGFKSVVVSCKADILGEDFIGRLFDKDLIQYLIERNICPCGENGEFHTFVIDGPIFKNRINITESRKILKEGFWEHWFLDIKKYEFVGK